MWVVKVKRGWRYGLWLLTLLKAGCGPVALRDGSGKWFAGFSKSIGDCQSDGPEEWALLEGLRWAGDMGL